jgi:DNA-binding MurR/RpiR family transcriptional regulator
MQGKSKQNTPPNNLLELKLMIASKEIALPDQLNRVLREAIARPDLVAFGSSNSIATACRVSPTTVVRLARLLGFNRFRDFRTLFREHLRERATSFQSRTWAYVGQLGEGPL